MSDFYARFNYSLRNELYALLTGELSPPSVPAKRRSEVMNKTRDTAVPARTMPGGQVSRSNFFIAPDASHPGVDGLQLD